MAKNWSMKEATQAIVAGDKEAILDIGRRFPLLLNNIVGALNGNADSFIEIVNALPDYDTANKINKKMKDAVEGTDDDDDAEDVEEQEEEKKPAKKASTKKTAKKDADADDGDTDYSSMDARSLFKLCKERGISAEMRKPVKYYVGLLEKADAAEDTDDDDWGDDEEEKKPAKKSTKKAAKKDADEDDDWEI